MFDENNNTQEQEVVFPENLFEDDEPEINDTATVGEEDKGNAVSEEQIKNEEEKKSPSEDAGEVAAARSRALAQVERLSRETGFSGPWGNLFRTYPSLSRSEAYEQLGNAVKGGMTPLEAYQQNLLEQKERELENMRNRSAATKRSAGEIGGDNAEQKLDDFLEGFYSV